MAIPALYWRSLQLARLAIESDSDVWNTIKNAMRGAGLLDVKKNTSDVNGHSKDTNVAVTFVKLAPHNYMLIIVAAGTNASRLRDKVYDKLKSVQFL